MDDSNDQEFLSEERVILDALRRRLAAASTVLEAALLKREYAGAVATLETEKRRVAPGKSK